MTFDACRARREDRRLRALALHLRERERTTGTVIEKRHDLDDESTARCDRWRPRRGRVRRRSPVVWGCFFAASRRLGRRDDGDRGTRRGRQSVLDRRAGHRRPTEPGGSARGGRRRHARRWSPLSPPRGFPSSRDDWHERCVAIAVTEVRRCEGRERVAGTVWTGACSQGVRRSMRASPRRSFGVARGGFHIGRWCRVSWSTPAGAVIASVAADYENGGRSWTSGCRSRPSGSCCDATVPTTARPSSSS